MSVHPLKTSCLLALILTGLFSTPALAYVGPGTGLSAIGALLAVVAGVIVAIFGFVWYPIKRLIRQWRRRGTKKGDGTA